MESGDFDFEFYSDIPNAEDGLKQEAERRLRELTKGHKDLIGASVAVEEWANRTTSFVYRARVVAFIRPDNLAAEEKADTPEAALKGALDGVTRQIREQREKLRKRWKQP
jgi:ribosome-associated translation inhibitor RaiA